MGSPSPTCRHIVDTLPASPIHSIHHHQSPTITTSHHHAFIPPPSLSPLSSHSHYLHLSITTFSLSHNPHIPILHSFRLHPTIPIIPNHPLSPTPTITLSLLHPPSLHSPLRLQFHDLQLETYMTS